MNDLRLVYREEKTDDIQRPNTFNGEIIPGNFTVTEIWDFLKWNETEEYSTISIKSETNANFLIKMDQLSPACLLFNVILTNCPDSYDCEMTFHIMNSSQFKNASRTVFHKFTFKRPSFDVRVTIRQIRFTEEDGFINSDSLRVQITISHEKHTPSNKKGRPKTHIPSNYISPVSSQIIIPQESDSSDSEKEYDTYTEKYCGIRNQGATCYINSILQTLYHIPIFRKGIFEVNCESLDENYEKTILWNLQRLFAQMQTKRDPVSTKLLTNSFGWDNADIFHQQDIHEFLLKFLSIIEKQLKPTTDSKLISNLFQGKLQATIKCINVNFQSSNMEDFFTIPLDVKGCSSLEESLTRFTAPEYMNGTNQYNAEGHGFQDAILTTELTFLPPVLFFQLRRFEYDSKTNQKVKINTKLTFPLNLDMNPYMSKEAQKSDKNRYELFGVLAHAGNVENGHFFVFLRTSPDDQNWFKFNDSLVSKVSEKVAVEENFGSGDVTNYPKTSNSPHSTFSEDDDHSDTQNEIEGKPIKKNDFELYSAYMLVYVDQSSFRDLFCAVPNALIPKSCLAEVSDVSVVNNVLSVELYTDDSITSGRLTFSDPLKIEIRKTKTVADLYEKVAHKLNKKYVRMHYFFNERILGRLVCAAETKISSLCAKSFFVEADDEKPLTVFEDDVMLFVEFFSPFFKPFPMQFIRRVSVKRSESIATVIPIIEKKVNISPSQHLTAFIKLNQNLVEIDFFRTPDQLMLTDGTFVVFQVLPQFKQPKPLANMGEFGVETRYFDIFPESVPKLVDEYHKLLRETLVFTMICPLKSVQKVDVPASIDFRHFKMFVSRIFRVEVKSARSVLTLYRNNSIKPMEVEKFKEIGEVIHNNDQVTVCSIDKRQLFLRVILSFSRDAFSKDNIVLKFFPIGATVGEAVSYIRKANKIPADLPLRALAIKGAKVARVLANDELLEGLKNPLRIEVVPSDQKELKPDSFLAKFEKVTLQREEIVPFGMPFLFTIIPDEKFKETKKRIFSAIEVPEKVQGKIRFLFDTESEDEGGDEEEEEEEEKEDAEIRDDMVIAENPKARTQIAMLYPSIPSEKGKEEGVKLYD